jgi:ferric hydroxamate transport system substrate-binding protein
MPRLRSFASERRGVVVALVCVMPVVASGCGGGDDDGAPSRAGGVTVTDHAGRTITLDQPAERVVTTHPSSTQNVLALGVTPVGAADQEHYNDFMGGGDPLPGDVASIGEQHEPNLEKMAALNPDLIVIPRDLPQQTREGLERFAPIVTIDISPAPGSRPPEEWDQMRSELTLLGKLLGREQQAKDVLAELDETIEAQRERIEAAGRNGDTVAIAQGFTAGAPRTWLFDGGSQLLEVVHRLGLENAFDGKPQEYSVTEVGLEGLRQVGAADWLLAINDPGKSPFTQAWAENPAFEALPVIKQRGLRELGADVYPWGGPRSAQYAAVRIAAAITGRNSE